MILEKTLNHLKEAFKETDPNKKYNDNMNKILSKLQDKAAKLEAQLENEKNEKNRKNINLMLKVISKQQARGEKLMQERARDSHSSVKHELIVRPELSPRILLGN